MWYKVRIVTIIQFCSHALLVGMLPQTPALKFYTPNSILEYQHLYIPGIVGNRKRYASCTSAAWFHGHYLVLLNLYGNHMRVYHFDEKTYTLQLIQEILDPNKTHFCMPEHVAISPDETLLLIANSDPPSMNLYAILADHTINSQPLCRLKYKELVHNVRFAPNGNYCACVRFNKRTAICIYAIERYPNTIRLRETYSCPNRSYLEPKAITFTHNGRFVLVAYALAIIDSKHMPYETLLVVHEFDQKRGVLGKKICGIPGVFSIEDISLSPDQTFIFATDQAHDQLAIYPFNPDTGIIDPQYTLHTNPNAQLSFPHGLDISRDGKYLAVTNYGDDSCNIYDLDASH